MFLSLTLDHFAPVAERRGDDRRPQFHAAAADYRRAAEGCFDGDRYLRAFADDGTPLGKAGQAACALDSLTQSFAVLAGAGCRTGRRRPGLRPAGAGGRGAGE